MKNKCLQLFNSRTLFFCSFLFFFSTSVAYGVSGQFRIGTLIGDDTTPPSVPSPFEAIPIAPTQINLSWGSSTDDWILSGYHVWRDTVQIATTTNTTYADTGLTPSTTYTYYVTAYDPFFNESASSTVIATTTPSVPAVATSTSDATQGTRIVRFENEIVSLVVLPDRDSVVIRYETKNYIQALIKWGRTTSYEFGSLLEHAFTKFHETTITGLTPETRYQFTIEGFSRTNKHGVLHIGEFTTLPQEDVFPPGNITEFNAQRLGDDVVLSWNNPYDADFDAVRIVASNTFYPSDPYDGWVVYEGDGTQHIEQDVAITGSWRYYTAFSYDALGNVSSGAATRVFLGSGEDLEVQDPEIDPSINTLELDLSDLIFRQEGEIIRSENNWTFAIDGSKQLTLAIPYERLPEHLKTILVVLKDSQDSEKEFKFLLRVNKDKTEYVGTLAPFGLSGVYPFQISIFDFKLAQVAYTQGVFISELTEAGQDSTVTDSEKVSTIIKYSILIFFILILLLLLYGVRRLFKSKL